MTSFDSQPMGFQLPGVSHVRTHRVPRDENRPACFSSILRTGTGRSPSDSSKREEVPVLPRRCGSKTFGVWELVKGFLNWRSLTSLNIQIWSFRGFPLLLYIA